MTGRPGHPSVDGVEIRPASAGDLEPLGAVFASERRFFAGCLARQEAGGGVLLVAWLDGWPAGDVFLSLGPADEPEVRRHLPGVPTLVHLEVVGRLQRRGIGTALVQAGEDAARRLGHGRIALGVGLDNPGARRLYERLGYTDWGHGHTGGSSREQGPGSAPVTVTETIDMLVKRL
jgi:GNAT superfamily N-acetyltransferase